MKRVILFATFLLLAQCGVFCQTNLIVRPGDALLKEAEQKLRSIEREWATAVKQHDTNKVAQIEAEEFGFTDPGGNLWDRRRVLETIKSGDLEIDAFEFSDFKVRLYGETAVVTFRIVWTAQFRGADISGPQRMTDVFVMRDGRWQCVASQSTRMVQPGQ
jgi:hypothetical protein